MDYPGGNETLALCYQLKKAGYQHEALSDPNKWNEDHQALGVEEWSKGYEWLEHPTYGWYPNPGRIVLMQEVRALVGEEEFASRYGEGVNLHNSFSHEGWMAEWLKAKEEHDKSN